MQVTEPTKKNKNINSVKTWANLNAFPKKTHTHVYMRPKRT